MRGLHQLEAGAFGVRLLRRAVRREQVQLGM
jgi:hypothetical protein